MDLTRAFNAVVDDAEQDERSIIFRLNTDDVDDHGTVILPAGGRFDKHRALGGPVLWEHGLDSRRGKDPIATNLWTKAHGKKRPEIRARDQFLKDDFSQQRYEWYRDGKLTGVSIRFFQPGPNDYGPPTNDEIKERPELEPLRTTWRETDGKRGWVLRSWDMAEHSCVAVPSNPNTISIERSAAILECCRSGLWLPDDVKAQLEARTTSDSLGGMETGGATVEPENKPFNAERGEDEDDDEGEDRTKRYITEGSGKFTVHSESGKKLGTYGSKGGAEKRLKQVEWFKAHPDRSVDPHVIQEDALWCVYVGGNRMMGFADQTIAEECLRAMTSEPDMTRSLEYQTMQARARMDKYEAELARDLEEYIRLYKWGQV